MTPTRGTLVRRIMREHRAWLWPLAVLLAVNLVAVILGVLPMSRSVRAAEQRARQATTDAAAAETELRAVSAARDGRDAATRELAIFYRDVLPVDVAAARRVLQLRVAQLARTHQVVFARSTATPEAVRDSTLTRLLVAAELVGRYDDIRAFLYALETADDFVVVESIKLAEGEDAMAPLNLGLDVSTYYKAAPDVR